MISFLFGLRILVAGLWSSFYVSTSLATPHKHHTHRSHLVGRGLAVESYHPPTNFKTFDDDLDISHLSKLGDVNAMASSFLQSQLGVDSASISYNSGFSSPVATYAYFKQTHAGIPFANAVANVVFKDNSKPISMGHSFVEPSQISPSTPSLSVEDAISKAQDLLDGQYNGQPATLEYLARPDGSAALTHVVQIQNNRAGTWHEAFIDAHSGELLSVVDFVSHAEYTVVPINKNDVLSGTAMVVDPEDVAASPLGWHNNGTTNSTATIGNNAIVFFTKGLFNDTDVWNYQVTHESRSGLVFDYTYNTSIDPNQGLNLDAARANAFYVVNTLHDIYYKYGFTETAFNFQTSNFGKGGKEHDAVFVSVHDFAGLNNANFATPPDGLGGLCRMYIWNLTEPERDGAVANDILIHENTHGLSNRLTGGGTGRCLKSQEGGGLGEGWSDMMADWMQQTAEVKDYITGIYATGSPKGIRTYPYSTDLKVNPLMYSDAGVENDDQLHFIGEVWTNMLHNVLAALVKQHGWSDVARSDPTGPEGNVVFLHLFVDGLSIQPCEPTFQNARDAIIQADKVRYNGTNNCLLWKAFASRGLGVNATTYVNDATVPAEC